MFYRVKLSIPVVMLVCATVLGRRLQFPSTIEISFGVFSKHTSLVICPPTTVFLLVCKRVFDKHRQLNINKLNV